MPLCSDQDFEGNTAGITDIYEGSITKEEVHRWSVELWIADDNCDQSHIPHHKLQYRLPR